MTTEKGAYKGLFECKFCNSRKLFPEEGYTTKKNLETWANEPTDICMGNRELMKAPHWEPLVNDGPMLNKHQYILVEVIHKNDLLA